METDEPGFCMPEDGDWSSPDQTWIWNEDRMARLLDDHKRNHLFVGGCRSNQGNFYDRFDHIVALTAPLNVMLDRVERRSNNPFGSSESDRQQITQDKLEFEPMILRGADIVIDTSATSPEDIADQLEALL